MPAQEKETTRSKILRAVEEEIADRGFANTSMRTVTGRIGVNLAAVNYHFGSKQALFEIVIIQQFEPIFSRRRESLLGLLSAEGQASPTLAQVLSAWVDPVFESIRESAARTRMLAEVARYLSSQVSYCPDSFFRQHFRPIFALLDDSLDRCVTQELEASQRHDLRVVSYLLYGAIMAADGSFHQTGAEAGKSPEEQQQQLPENERELRRFIHQGFAGLPQVA